MEQIVSLYSYIIEHLNEDGFFTETVLPDEAGRKNAMDLGAWDADTYRVGSTDNMKLGREIVRALRGYIMDPGPASFTRLTGILKGHAMSEYCNAFFQLFDRIEMNVTVFTLAKELFYGGKYREQVKFAYLLFSLKGMEFIKVCHNRLWRDMVKVAHCEEFTFPFLFACRGGGYFPRREVWELLGCTKGWGKIFCLMDCQCNTDAERMWLIRHGAELEIEYPPISLRLIEETRLEKFLQQAELDYGCYKGAALIVIDFLVALPRFSEADMAANFNIHDVDIYSLVERILQNAERLIDKLEDLMDIGRIAEALRSIEEENKPLLLSSNQCHELIARCDAIIYDPKWWQNWQQELFEGGRVNYELCDYAYNSGMDIWPQLMDYWDKHPEEVRLFPYLLSPEEKERGSQVIHKIASRLRLYTGEGELLVPLRYLKEHPGEGEAIICAALNSIYDLPRWVACVSLHEWGSSYVTPVIRQALFSARRLSVDKRIKDHVEFLLQPGYKAGSVSPKPDFTPEMLN